MECGRNIMQSAPVEFVDPVYEAAGTRTFMMTNTAVSRFGMSTAAATIRSQCARFLLDTVITGPGRVYLQTMTVADLAKLIIPFIPEKK